VAVHACAASKPRAEEAPAALADASPPVVVCRPTGAEPAAETPTKEDVMHAMSFLNEPMADCAFSGVAEIGFAFMSNGCLEEVPNVILSANQTDEAVITCVQRVGATAMLPPFGAARFKVLYPFKP
jgi:hypothetical protein